MSDSVRGFAIEVGDALIARRLRWSGQYVVVLQSDRDETQYRMAVLHPSDIHDMSRARKVGDLNLLHLRAERVEHVWFGPWRPFPMERVDDWLTPREMFEAADARVPSWWRRRREIKAHQWRMAQRRAELERKRWQARRDAADERRRTESAG